jgi:hypothetical protein
MAAAAPQIQSRFVQKAGCLGSERSAVRCSNPRHRHWVHPHEPPPLADRTLPIDCARGSRSTHQAPFRPAGVERRFITDRIARIMSYKDPSFQDRAASAAQAKEKALEQLRAKLPPDPELVARRAEAQARRQAAQAEKSAAKKNAAEAARQEKAAAAAAEAAAAASAPTAAEKKAARDLRYAARKARK